MVYKIDLIILKKIEIVTSDEKLLKVNELLSKFNVGGVTIHDIKGRGKTNLEPLYVGRGVTRYTPLFGTRITMEVIVSDTIYKEIINALIDELSTGSVSDGKIWVYDVFESYDIGTKNIGEQAL